MRHLTHRTATWIVGAALVASTVWQPRVAGLARQFAPPPATALKPRVPFPKPAESRVIDGATYPDNLVVKFREATRIRLKGQVLTAEAADKTVAAELAAANGLLASTPGLRAEKVFGESEEQLERDKQLAETRSGREASDLNLFVRLLCPGAKPAEAEQLLDRLNALGIVEVAYAQPVGYPAQMDIAPPTMNFVAEQTYLGPAGIDASFARTRAGGRGEFVSLIDIETGWHLDHEDLPQGAPQVFHQSGLNIGDHNHGTSVLGMLVAAENNYGHTGIVPRAGVGVASPVRPFYDVPGAINEALANLQGGGVILIEQHYPGPRTDIFDLWFNGNQFGMLPVESAPADFEAISRAASRGVIVVEAAGNGAQNLDDPLYGSTFDPTARHSGAIMVGAASPGGFPMPFTNFGRRVDLHAWGISVATLGGGDRFAPPGGDPRQRYTSVFSGTSSASAMVAGAVCALISVRRAAGLPDFPRNLLVRLLQDTGTPQVADGRNIGQRPDLQAAILAMESGAAPSRVINLPFTVPESAFDVDTGIDLLPGDHVVFSASGDIEAGVLPGILNGPNGFGPGDLAFPSITTWETFPIPTPRFYSLLGKLNGSYFFIGFGAERTQSSGPSRLFLRINDNVPGNGSGAFTCQVQVWR